MSARISRQLAVYCALFALIFNVLGIARANPSTLDNLLMQDFCSVNGKPASPIADLAGAPLKAMQAHDCHDCCFGGLALDLPPSAQSPLAQPGLAPFPAFVGRQCLVTQGPRPPPARAPPSPSSESLFRV
ncbi:DUF2946 family protein [Parachitinimonas caeni]|uniref:DUF2946 domain-containing protein n=1 Tax=Parachitinimonas caeni TaxID=3031301 RepID=A0ABT7E1G8_9NEIS|nr:DUF2946 family protein [Parachitinimonas caeni]MDK2125889.1 hypothetical protein [Parachitinimonas caeni]